MNDQTNGRSRRRGRKKKKGRLCTETVKACATGLAGERKGKRGRRKKDRARHQAFARLSVKKEREKKGKRVWRTGMEEEGRMGMEEDGEQRRRSG